MENKKRIVVDVPREFHATIKSQAAFINVSMAKWIMQAIIEKIEREKIYR